MLGLKLCKVCAKAKSYDISQKYGSKASGFKGSACWECHCAKANSISKAWCMRNPEKVKAKNAALSNAYKNAAVAKYRLEHSDRVKITQREWHEQHPEYRAQYFAARRQANSLFKLRNSLSCLTYQCFKLRSWGKTTKTQALLGCTFEEFAAHLQSKFQEGMALENHGEWHIDHIKPCAMATSPEELAALFHYTNLQPLWASENISKGSKYYGNEERT